MLALAICAFASSGRAQVVQNVPGFWGHMVSEVTEYFLPPYSGQPTQVGTSGTGLLFGSSNNDPVEVRSYNLFDLSGVQFGPVVSTTLDMKAGSWVNQPGPSETIELWDVSASNADLRGAWSSTVFADLGSGLSYGQSTLSAPSNFDERKLMTFNSDGISAINSALGSGEFKVGMTLVTMGPPDDIIFGNGTFTPDAVRLQLTDAFGGTATLTLVPEPSSYTLLSSVALLGFLVFKRFSQ